MKKIIVLLLIGLLIISCKKENQNTSQTSPEIQKSLPEVEQNSRKNIASIGDNIDVWYETNDSVVFAKKNTNEQLVIVCDNTDYDYSQKQIIGQIKYMLEHRSKSLENSINFTEKRIIPIGKKYSYKIEEIYDEYYKTTVTRYFITYKEIYGEFNV